MRALAQFTRLFMSVSVAAVKEYLNHGSHLKLKRNAEIVLSTLHGNPICIKPHFTSSVLSSATLTTSYIKNHLIRNQESLNGGTIRKILGLTDYKHQAWKFKLDQSTRKSQYQEVLKELEFEEKKLLHLIKFKCEELEELEGKLARVQESLKQVKMTLKLMKDTVIGSLHPEPRNTDSVEDEIVKDQDRLKIRGMLVRIAGPRKGNRAMTWEKSVGAISVNSVDYVVSEESKVQIPSKLGIYGLYVRIV